MNLFVTRTVHDYFLKGDVPVMSHNPKVDYVCYCECGGYGTRNQYGRDEYCPECGKYLDWGKEVKW